MELLRKTDVHDNSIVKNDKYNENEDYVKGFFCNLESIKNNEDFLCMYRYIQYWKLDIPQILIDYCNIPNYCKLSLIENMLLTGNDSYFELLHEKIINHTEIEDKEYEGEIDEDIEMDYFLKHPEYIKSAYNKGISINCNNINDIENTSSIMKLAEYSIKCCNYIDDDIILFYIRNGMGGLAISMISSVNDLNYIFDECFIPKDMDIYKYYIDKIHDGDQSKINDLTKESYIYKLIESEKLDNYIDIAFFMYLYNQISSKLPGKCKLMILLSVLKTDNRMLISCFLKEITKHIEIIDIEDIVIFDHPNRNAYISLKIEIENSNNYEAVYDFAFEINHRAEEIKNKSKFIEEAGYCSDYSDVEIY